MSQIMRILVLAVLIAFTGGSGGCGKALDSTVKVEADESLNPAIDLFQKYLEAQNAPIASATESTVYTYTSAHTPTSGQVVAVTSCSTVLGVRVRCGNGRIDLNRAEITVGVIVSGTMLTHTLPIHARLSTTHCADATFFPGELMRVGGGEADVLLISRTTEEMILEARSSTVGDSATLVVEVDPADLPPSVDVKVFVSQMRVYDEISGRMLTLETRYVESGWFRFFSEPSL